jgi:fatty-acyl-CoA synthase
MKLSFSTLACPFWSFSEIFSAAKDLGYSGIEIRGIEREMYAPKVREFSKENLPSTIKRFKSANLEIPIFTSAAYLYDIKNKAAVLREAYDYVDLASEAGVKYIRVLGDKDINQTDDININSEFVLDNFNDICKYAESKNVTVLIETNGYFADSKRLLKFMQQVPYKNAGVIWDIHHTVRFFNEKPEFTVETLGKMIKHVHLKDSIMENGKVLYRMMGKGDIPVKDSINALKSIGYDGFLSLEWVKRWAPDLEDAGIALPYFIYYIKNLNV